MIMASDGRNHHFEGHLGLIWSLSWAILAPRCGHVGAMLGQDGPHIDKKSIKNRCQKNDLKIAPKKSPGVAQGCAGRRGVGPYN